MDSYLFLLGVLAIVVWWQWRFGVGWTIRTFRRWKGRS